VPRDALLEVRNVAESIARGVLWLTAGYAGIGLVFALTFAALGAARIDPNARAASFGFRVVILPGATALWPQRRARHPQAAGRPRRARLLEPR